jgi:hypothetical protein
MPGEKGVLVYTDDGTPYYIPTDQLAQFEVTGDSLSALQQETAKGPEPDEDPSVLSAYHPGDIGPGPIPQWPIWCRP